MSRYEIGNFMSYDEAAALWRGVIDMVRWSSTKARFPRLGIEIAPMAMSLPMGMSRLCEPDARDVSVQHVLRDRMIGNE